VVYICIGSTCVKAAIAFGKADAAQLTDTMASSYTYGQSRYLSKLRRTWGPLEALGGCVVVVVVLVVVVVVVVVVAVVVVVVVIGGTLGW